jgi:uncharacterized integral membrane protein (TIGR00697 family)
VRREQLLFTVLGGFFITNAILAEMIGGKLIYFGDPTWKIGPFGPGFAMTVGIIPWPIVFVTTDLVNEYFGRRGVRRLTFLTVGLIAYAYLVLLLTMRIPATSFSAVDDASYNKVFGQSLWIIVGSIAAFMISQLIDVVIFHVLRRKTGKAMLWLRSTGSTVVSQLIDSLVVLYIGLALPLGWSAHQYFNVVIPNYLVKLFLALALTPLIYAAHWAVERFLGEETAGALAEEAARSSQRAP